MTDLILFDIDGVLFDPHKFGSLIRAEFVKILKIKEDELVRANADYYSRLEESTDFNPRDIVLFLSDRFGVDRQALDQVFWGDGKIYKEAVYRDVEEVVKNLSGKHSLGIFSQGGEELQERKLSAGGIRKYFKDEHIFVATRKLMDEAIAKIPNDATVVDNRHDVVTTLASHTDVIWLNRVTGDNDEKIKTIHTLKELLVTS